MSRPFAMILLLLLIAFTSQFEWKKKVVIDVEASPIISQKRMDVLRTDESVKEKIILSQEKSIQKLNELIHSLQEQLQHCQDKIEVPVNTVVPLSELLRELEQQEILED
ncbi:hypothetical protein NMG60_11008622 [Bertholletia excelsa]